MEEECSLAIFGRGGVGKSALTVRLCTNDFPEECGPTMARSLRKHLTIDGIACILDILDTAEPEEYRQLYEQDIRQREGFVLVYSITCRSSFEAITEYFNRIMRARSTSAGEGDNDDDDAPPIMIVGNKCDLEDTRVVSTKEGAELAESLGCSFLEASAKTRINADELFIELARRVLAVKAHERQLRRETTSNKTNRCIVS